MVLCEYVFQISPRAQLLAHAVFPAHLLERTLKHFLCAAGRYHDDPVHIGKDEIPAMNEDCLLYTSRCV